MELNEERKAVLQRLQTYSKDQLKAQGYTLFDLIGKKSKEKMFDKLIISFQRRDSSELGYHRFNFGDLVTICRSNPLKENVIEGTILDFGKHDIRVILENVFTWKDENDKTWRIDQGANTIAYTRMKAAVRTLNNGDPNHSKEDLCGTYLADVILGRTDDGQSLEDIASKPSGLFTVPYSVYKGLQMDYQKGEINESQFEAIKKCLARRFTIVHGPPGTGKTTTVVRWIKTVRQIVKFPILATAFSNVAVDNCLQACLEQGLSAVRIGSPVKVRDLLRESTLTSKLQKHKLTPTIEKEQKLLIRLSQDLKYFKGLEREDRYEQMVKQREKVNHLKQQRYMSIIDEADVICATCIGSGGDELRGIRFPIVIIDECTQSIEPGTLVPLARGSKHVVLMGDHYQLPPVVLSEKASELSKSLLERLVQEGIQPSMLRTQYRMHPMIAEFPSLYFYEGKLENGLSAKQRIPIRAFPWPQKDAPVVFINFDSPECDTNVSKTNPGEAELIVNILKMLIQDDSIRPRHIGVISMYSAQVNLIYQRVQQAGGIHSGQRFAHLEIKTVDGFQGREKECIILSTVRCNSQNNLGFLKDYRRLNVAITR